MPWFDRMNFVSGYSSREPRPSTTIDSASTSIDGAVAAREHDVAGVDRGPVLEAGADERRLRDHQRHGLPLHVRAHQRAVRVVVLEERDQRGRDRDDLRRRDVHVLDRPWRRPSRPRPPSSGTAPARGGTCRSFVDRLRGLRDRELRLLGGVQIDDLVGHLAALDHAVRRLDEAELGHRRERGQRRRSGRCSGLPASRSGTCARSGSGGRRAPRSARARASDRRRRAPTGGGGA